MIYCFERAGKLSKILKVLMSSNYHRVEYFFAESRAVLEHLQKRIGKCFYLFQILSYLQKLKKRPCFYALTETRYFRFSLITQVLSKSRKIPNMLLQILLSRTYVQTFSNMCKRKFFSNYRLLYISIFQTNNLAFQK